MQSVKNMLPTIIAFALTALVYVAANRGLLNTDQVRELLSGLTIGGVFVAHRLEAPAKAGASAQDG